jgi:hypothetical protein
MPDTEDSEVQGMLTLRSAIPRGLGCRYRERGDANGARVPILRNAILRARGYQWSKDANTNGEGMPMPNASR